MRLLALLILFHLDLIQSEDSANLKILTTKVYSNLFVRKREDQKLLIKHLQSQEKYEKRYSLIEIALKKILPDIPIHRSLLESAEIDPKADFPKNQTVVESLTFVLENLCLVGDIVLHFPNISYRILKSFKDWHAVLNWALRYTLHFDQILDPSTQKMLSLFDQELNIDQRTADYINPYVEETQSTTKKPPKPRKKLKKGPQLSRTEL